MNISRLNKTELIGLKSSIDKRLNDLQWEEVIENVKNLEHEIDLTNVEEVKAVKVLSVRFMLFDLAKKMKSIEIDLKGYSEDINLKSYSEALSFFNNKYS